MQSKVRSENQKSHINSLNDIEKDVNSFLESNKIQKDDQRGS